MKQGGSAAGFFVDSIRSAAAAANDKVLFYNGGEIGVGSVNAKPFVIPHPTNNDKYLVHVCLEGPEAGIYYRGKGTIINDTEITIELPDYAKLIGYDFTTQITRLYSGKETLGLSYQTSEVIDGKFTVYGTNGSFYWLVQGKRSDIEVEPNKDDYQLHGDGPYTYITPKKL